MQNNHSKLNQLQIIRIITSLIFLGLLVIFISQNLSIILRVGIVFLWGIILLLNYFLTKRIKLGTQSVGLKLNPKTTQVQFIIIVTIVCFIGLYRGITAEETYQQVIGYITTVVCAILDGFLVWGLKFIK